MMVFLLQIVLLDRIFGIVEGTQLMLELDTSMRHRTSMTWSMDGSGYVTTGTVTDEPASSRLVVVRYRYAVWCAVTGAVAEWYGTGYTVVHSTMVGVEMRVCSSVPSGNLLKVYWRRVGVLSLHLKQ